MNATTFPESLTSPAEIHCPYPGCTDRGLTLTHDVSGEPRNYVHTVECRDKESCKLLAADGFHQSHGYVRSGTQAWVYTKRFPLYVAEWQPQIRMTNP